MRVRHKPTETEAHIFNADTDRGDHLRPRGVLVDRSVPGRRAFCVNAEGQRCYLADGDVIVLEPDGVHWYRLDRETFDKYYEVVGN